MKIFKELIPINGRAGLPSELAIPSNAKGVVIFSHGSGSGPFSVRNRTMATHLQKEEWASLLFDHLTEDEEDQNYLLRYDIELLAQRLIQVTHWVESRRDLQNLPVGFFGASTGGASALMAAARLGDSIKAVVARGGRPDLVTEELDQLSSPTLLLVGALDFEVISFNRQAFHRMYCIKDMKIIEDASHLFEEPGALEKVGREAALWYEKYLVPKHLLDVEIL